MSDSRTFMTDHEMITEIRTDLRALKERFYQFTDGVITREEFNMWEQTRRTTVRWAIGTIISIIAVAATSVGIIVLLIGLLIDLLFSRADEAIRRRWGLTQAS